MRGIVAGDILRRLVGRTLAQQLGKAAATSPFQYALSTRAGSECVAHDLQAMTERNSEATVLSIDGISAFDLVSRNAMLEGLRKVLGGDQVLTFVLMFSHRPLTCGTIPTEICTRWNRLFSLSGTISFFLPCWALALWLQSRISLATLSV